MPTEGGSRVDPALPLRRVLRRLEVAVPAVVAAGCVAFAGVLAVTSFLGWFVRPTSDDYCIAAKERDWGLLAIVRQYYFHLNGRVGNAFASGAVYVGGGGGTKLLPALLLLLLVAGLGGIAYQVFRRLGVPGGPRAALAALFAAVSVVATSMWGAHNSYQVIFWAPGSVSHTLPSALAGVYVAVALLAGARWSRVVMAVGVVTGFAVATVSEAFALTGGTAAVVLIAYLLVHGPRWGAVMRAAVALVVGLGVGLLVIATSPGLAARNDLVGDRQLSGPAAARRAAHMLGTVVREAFSARVLVTAIATGVLLALLLPRLAMPRRAVAWLAAASVALPFVMAFEVITALGVGYGARGWAVSRAWGDFVVLSVVAFVAIGMLAATLVRAALERVGDERPALVRPLAGAAALVAATAGIVWGVARQVDDAQRMGVRMVTRAVAFDKQAATIHAERAAGQQHLVVVHELPIAGLAEPYTLPAPRDWTGACAAVYFKVDAIHRPGRAVRFADLYPLPR